jgi:hypothetical protein
MMRPISLILTVLLILNCIAPPKVYGQERDVGFKDPAWAFIWGIIFPGGGQYYNGQTAEGTRELIWESPLCIVLITALAGVGYINSQFAPGVQSIALPFGVTMVRSQGESIVIALAAGGAALFAIVAVFRMASAFKAVEDARKINRGELIP